MRHLVWILSFTAFLARADVIDRERILRDLDPANTEFAREEAWLNLPTVSAGPGFIIGEYHRRSPVGGVRATGGVLWRTFGQALHFRSKIGGRHTPTFNGLILDRDGLPLANVKFADQTPDRNDVVDYVRDRNRKFTRQARGEDWLHYAFVQAHALVYHYDDDCDYPVTLDEAQMERYRDRIVVIRRMMRFFAAGRPSWMLLRLHDDATLSRDDRAELIRIVDTAPGLARLLILQNHQILTIDAQGPRVNQVPGCEDRFR